MRHTRPISLNYIKNIPSSVKELTRIEGDFLVIKNLPQTILDRHDAAQTQIQIKYTALMQALNTLNTAEFQYVHHPVDAPQLE